MKRFIGCLLVAFSIGCGATSPPVEEDELSTEEAKALVFGVYSFSADTTLTVLFVESELTAVLGCPLGGQFTGIISSEETQQADTVGLTINIQMMFRDCEFEEDGYYFSVPEGDITVTFSILTIRVEDLLLKNQHFRGGISGLLKWTLDDRQGVCDDIHLVLDAKAEFLGPDGVEVTGSFEGPACGQHVDFGDPNQIASLIDASTRIVERRFLR